MNYRRLGFNDALRILGELAVTVMPKTYDQLQPPSEPPPGNWQRSARKVVEQAEETLWSSTGESALNYLLERD